MFVPDSRRTKTFVASTMSLRRASNAWPSTSSDLTERDVGRVEQVYTCFDKDFNLAPDLLRLHVAHESEPPSTPSVMVPKLSTETSRPLAPNNLYSMRYAALSFDGAVATGQESCRTGYNRGVADSTAPPTPVLSFEVCLDELEKVVKELEGGDLPLERSLALFEKGMSLSETCRKQLEEAETRVEMLIRKGSKIQPEPFRPEKA